MSYTVPYGCTLYRLKGQSADAPVIQHTYTEGTVVSDSPYYRYYSGQTAGQSYTVRDVLVQTYDDNGVYYSYEEDVVFMGVMDAYDWDIGQALNKDCNEYIYTGILATAFNNTPVTAINIYNNIIKEFAFYTFEGRTYHIEGIYCTNCEELECVSGKIPNTVQNINFGWCPKLTTVPAIPQSVTSLNGAFMGCTALTGAVVINATTLSDYDSCFYDTVQPIRLMGTSPYLTQLAQTATNDNVVIFNNLNDTTWLLNANLTEQYIWMGEPKHINFTSNGQSYMGLIRQYSSPSLGFKTDEVRYYEDSSYDDLVFSYGRWYKGEAYRTIEISGGADTSNVELIDWLASYGRLWTVAQSLIIYTKTNNQWVEGTPYIKANNNWAEASQLFIKQNNTWTEI